MRHVAVLLLMSACAASTTAVEEAAVEESGVEETPEEPAGLNIEGPVRLITVPDQLNAQRLLMREQFVRQLRLADDGRLETLALADIEVPLGEPHAMAIDALTRFASAYGPFAAKDLVLERVLNEDGETHVRLRQHHDGVAIDDRTIDVHFSPSGKLTHITGSPIELGVSAQPAVTLDGTLRFVRVATGEYRLAWRQDAGDESAYFDAEDGALLFTHNHLNTAHFTGSVYPHNSTQGGRKTFPLANLNVRDMNGSYVTDASGNASTTGDVEIELKGPFVNVFNEDLSRYTYRGPGELALDFNHYDKRAGELAAFVHVNRAHDWFTATFGFTRLDKVVKATVRAEECMFNAWARGTSELTFGDGCGLYDYAQNADYVFHEYVHLVTNSIVDVDYSQYNESGAYSEGNSDYFACSILDDPNWGDNPINVMERHCDNDKRYEKDYSGESHSGAEIFSGSVWDLRKKHGQAVADTLAYRAMFSMPKKPMLIDARDAFLAADRAHFAGAHVGDITAAFGRHGIDDKLQVFVTSNLTSPKRVPFEATVTAHAQGFDRNTMQYKWEFNDGEVAYGDEVVHVFTKKSPGAKVTVTDASGKSLYAAVTFSGCRSTGGDPSLLLVLLAISSSFVSRRLRPSLRSWRGAALVEPGPSDAIG